MQQRSVHRSGPCCHPWMDLERSALLKCSVAETQHRGAQRTKHASPTWDGWWIITSLSSRSETIRKRMVRDDSWNNRPIGIKIKNQLCEAFNDPVRTMEAPYGAHSTARGNCTGIGRRTNCLSCLALAHFLDYGDDDPLERMDMNARGILKRARQLV